MTRFYTEGYKVMQLVVAENSLGSPPCIRAAPSDRHRRFMQCGWSYTGRESRTVCAIAIITQNLPGGDPQMKNHPCFERSLRPQENSRSILRCCVLCRTSCRNTSWRGLSTLAITKLERGSSVLHKDTYEASGVRAVC